jgi:hypothetical protein
MVGVSIDGKRTSDCRFVLDPNSEVVVERYINKGNLDSGNKFKFIERTAAVEKHRGVGSDDGLVRAEFWAEREVVQLPKIEYTTYPDWKPGRRSTDHWPTRSRSLRSSPQASSGPRGITGQSFNSFEDLTGGIEETEQIRGGHSVFTAQNMNVASTSSTLTSGFLEKFADVNDAGITVPGGISNQQFHHVSGFELETSSTVIILQLKGQVGNATVVAPVTVEYKPTCITCGKTNKATNKFCSECGTGLQLV